MVESTSDDSSLQAAAKLMSEAIHTGNAVEVVRLLDSGFPVNRTLYADLNHTPLHAAAASGRLDMCALLLDRGANLEARLGTGVTPLGNCVDAAARRDVRSACEFLLREGADPNSVNYWQHTSLHRLAEASTETQTRDQYSQRAPGQPSKDSLIELARLLVRYGASPSFVPPKPGVHYKTPLQYAVEQGALGLVRFYIGECGEDPTQRSVTGRTLLQIAKSDRTRAFLRPIVRAARSARAVGDSIENSTASAQDIPQTSRRSSPGLL